MTSPFIIDVNAQYGVVPGDDVTSLLNTILATSLAPGVSLDIIFSEPGTYYIDGPTQTGTELGYTYSGAVLIPAVAWDGDKSCALRIRSIFPITTGDPYTGDTAGGVILATRDNTAGRYLFAAVPHTTKWGWHWTGVMPHFENIKFEHPADPQGGSVDAYCCLRAKFTRVICSQGGLSANEFPTGTSEAIILPAIFNNGDITLREIQVRGWGYGIRLSEHCVLDSVDISYCGAAFTFAHNNSGHANWFGYVDVEECRDVFLVQAENNVYIVDGNMDLENISLGSKFYPTALANVVHTSSGLAGQLAIACVPTGSLALRGAGQNNVSISVANAILKHDFSHPVDTFARMGGGDQPSGSAPGLTWPTLDAWKVGFGSFAITNGGLLNSNTGGGAAAYLLPRDGKFGGRTRRVQSTFTLPSTYYDYALIGHWQVSGSNAGSNAVSARVTGGSLILSIGSPPNGGIVKTIASAVSNGGTYTLTLDLHVYAGKLIRVDLWLNGTLQYTHACSSAQQLGASPSDPYLGDGLWINDNATVTTSFQVTPLESPPCSLADGTVNLVAGKATIAYASVGASAVIRVTRQTVSGTSGHLSVTVTAGTGFTINSTSTTDVGTVLWEIVRT